VSFEPQDLGGPYATVIDVGAFRGDFARACLARWRDVRVLSFEPLEPAPRALAGHRRRWAWYSVALGNRVGRVEINRNEFIPSSSILPMAELHREAFPYTKGSERAEVGMALLDEFYEHVSTPALLKVDVQGYELEVLKGATEVLMQVETVVAEVSHEELYEGAPTFSQLDEFLGRYGFEHQGRVDELRHPQRESLLLQSDELWVRS